MKKLAVLIAAVMAAVVVFAGCGGAAEIVKPLPSEGAKMVTVTGDCTATLSGGTLTVSGTTDMMDGTNGIVSVVNSDGTTAEEYKFTLSGGRVSHDFAVSDKWQDTVYGFVSFDTQNADKQPDEVLAVYGKNFANIEGAPEDVIWNAKGVIAIFMSDAIEVR